MTLAQVEERPIRVFQALQRHREFLARRPHEAHEHEAALIRATSQPCDRHRTPASAVHEYAAFEGCMVHKARKSEPKYQHYGDQQEACDRKNGTPDPQIRNQVKTHGCDRNARRDGSNYADYDANRARTLTRAVKPERHRAGERRTGEEQTALPDRSQIVVDRVRIPMKA